MVGKVCDIVKKQLHLLTGMQFGGPLSSKKFASAELHMVLTWYFGVVTWYFGRIGN
jgi:hypothetical protein